MRIAIIGGGFYGCLTALAASSYNDIQVDLFEKNNELMRGAIVANQHRLHLGFHYPRCDATISQAISSFPMFASAYPSAVVDIQNNIYCTHRAGHVSGEQFSEMMTKHGLQFEKTEIPAKIVCANDLDLAVRTGEKMIDLLELRRLVIDQVAAADIKVHLGTKINIDEIKGQYDWVINCTYTDPGAGCGIRTKSELAVMLLLRSDETWKGQAITIMDGPFCSIYPAGDALHTLSSVVFTPAIKAGLASILEKTAESISESDWNFIENSIWEHASKFFDLTGLERIGRYVTIKTKIEDDKNDFRGTVVFGNENVISVMAGKISCAFLAVQEIMERMGKKWTQS